MQPFPNSHIKKETIVTLSYLTFIITLISSSIHPVITNIASSLPPSLTTITITKQTFYLSIWQNQLFCPLVVDGCPTMVCKPYSLHSETQVTFVVKVTCVSESQITSVHHTPSPDFLSPIQKNIGHHVKNNAILP